MVRLIRRSALRALSHAAPGVAAGLFEKALLTPDKVRRCEDPQPAAESTAFRIPYGSGWLAAWSWGEGPTVLLLHGWGGAATSLTMFVDPLVERGFRVVAYDAPAHGQSDGQRTNLVECAGAALQVGRSVGPLRAIIAHSFGAPAAALAVQYGLKPECMVMLAPPQSIIDLSMEVGDVIGFPRHVCELMGQRLASRLRIDWEELATDRLVDGLGAPLLVVHDRDDRTVPWTHGEAIADAATRGQLLSTTGLGHWDIKTQPDVMRQVLDFVSRSTVWVESDSEDERVEQNAGEQERSDQPSHTVDSQRRGLAVSRSQSGRE
jgi:pimeloyl-ACP methyl ester carboxylesterase